MRIHVFSLLVLAAIASAAPAQNAPPPAPGQLAQVLRDWDGAIGNLKSLSCVIERQSLDKALGVREVYKGYATYTKLNDKGNDIRFRLELSKVGAPDVMEKLICTGKDLHIYNTANKSVQVLKMPKAKDGFPLQNILALFLGFGGASAMDRYDLTLVQPSPPDKQYYYVRVKPKKAEDKNEFVEARISLLRSSNLPAQVWYLQPNGNEITWNITSSQLNPKIPIRYFMADVPPGWQVQNVNPLPMVPNKKP